MSGVIDKNGTQWEHCNGCGKFVKIDDLLYARIRPELIESRQREIDAWVAEADASPLVDCKLCEATGERKDWARIGFPNQTGCNGCGGTGQCHVIGPRGSGPRLTGDELLDLCASCAVSQA